VFFWRCETHLHRSFVMDREPSLPFCFLLLNDPSATRIELTWICSALKPVLSVGETPPQPRNAYHLIPHTVWYGAPSHVVEMPRPTVRTVG
jgi:hypothetical protein